MEWKSRDEQIIDSIARIEEKQDAMHDDIKTMLECDEKFDKRITSLEHLRTKALGITAFIIFLIGIAKSYGLI